MNETQLKFLIGCILICEGKELVIKEIENNVVLFNNVSNHISVHDFIAHYIPIFKIYLTEEEDSLVSITHYLKHYDLK